MALVWYLIIGKKSLALDSGGLRPGKKDVFSFVWGFPGLILTGAAISFIASRFSSVSMPAIQAPQTVLGWIVIVFSCAATGYLEESFFRYYLLRKLETCGIHPVPRIVLSTLLFALCHSYEGMFGILTAVCAGVLLSLLFEKYRTLHGIAWAHALYNVFVYAASFQ